MVEGTGPLGAPGTCFCRYLFHWRPLEKTRNSGSTQNDRKASHNHPKGSTRTDFSLIFMPLMQPFWSNFEVFVKLRKRQFCDDSTTLWKVFAFQKTCFSEESPKNFPCLFCPISQGPFRRIYGGHLETMVRFWSRFESPQNP